MIKNPQGIESRFVEVKGYLYSQKKGRADFNNHLIF